MTLPAAFANCSGPVHFVGVAGAGMISLAELFARSGLSVTGCDVQPDPAARALSSWDVRSSRVMIRCMSRTLRRWWLRRPFPRTTRSSRGLVSLEFPS